MTQIDHIRKAFFEEGRNITQIAEIFSCDRKTVRKRDMVTVLLS